ncbi:MULTISPECIES: S1 family peptidase [Streptomyces]|uniref:S1 family peptidase n=1 Tax=Streptomyces lycopersici TaxID=2974589 RepID=UPI0021CEAEF0|nr:serine protease [Streptomyces sp. NEAU-383]
MTSAGYWVELYQADERLGGGFLLTRRFVLTALHCLRGLSVDQHVVIVLADGERIDGRVSRQDKEADLALVEIAAEYRVTLPIPAAHVAHDSDRWRGPYRPASHDVHLSGHVSAGSADHLCVGGGTIEALHLTADQLLGDYSGYSGGPVEGFWEDGAQQPVVMGVLIEQARDRADGTRAANVLFAATIGEAMRRFDHFDVAHLIDVVRPPRRSGEPDADRRPATTGKFATAEAVLNRLDQWDERDVMDPAQIAELRFMTVKALIESELGGGGA